MMAWMEGISPEAEQKVLEKILQEVKELKQYQIPKEELLMERRFQYMDEFTGNIRFICVPVKTGAEEKKTEAPKQVKSSTPEQVLHVPLPEIPPVPGNNSVFEDFEDYSGNMRFAGAEEVMPAADRENAGKFTDAGEAGPPAEPEKDRPFTDIEDRPFTDTENRSFADIEENRRFTDIEENWPFGNSGEDSLLPNLEKDGFFINVDDTEEDFEDAEEDDSGTVLLRREDEEDEGTVLLQSIHGGRAELVRLRTQETFLIKGNECKIGKKQSDTDICLRNNPALSRLHCAIRYLAGAYYLEDLDSSNYTYVDGERALPGKPVKLHDSCKLRLADEEFLFQVR